ncbi:hypothetical protein B0H16DRAFT_1522837 [Mycena metata]|uniref:DUF6533 domain-containing protein n=1 Tax=Mycena metata TaxID=1033252 RepID=A0AAD7JLW8_9AGAR|nr:hypothetical protein B0H16DRAFT_1522837 [Mycena metata]
MSLTDPESNFQLVSRVNVGMLAALTYDTLLCIDQEYLFVWKSPWNLVKWLYFWTRYSTFVDTALSVQLKTQLHLNESTCHSATTFIRVFAIVGIMVTEVILTMRTYAIYGRSTKLLVFFVIMWSAIAGVNVWGMIEWTNTLVQVPGSPAHSCNLDSSTNAGLVCYRSLLAGDSVIVLLTAYKALRTFSLSRSAYRNSTLVTTFYRDGLLFYVAILWILIVDVSLENETIPGLKFIADAPLRVMQSLLACRLVLHARAVAAEEDVFPEETELDDVTALGNVISQETPLDGWQNAHY